MYTDIYIGMQYKVHKYLNLIEIDVKVYTNRSQREEGNRNIARENTNIFLVFLFLSDFLSLCDQFVCALSKEYR